MMIENCILIVMLGLVQGISVPTIIEMVVLLEVSVIAGTSSPMPERRFRTIMRVVGATCKSQLTG